MPRTSKRTKENKILCVKLERLPNNALLKYGINLNKMRRRSSRILQSSYENQSSNTTTVNTSVSRDESKNVIALPSINNAIISTNKLHAIQSHKKKRSLVNAEKSEYVVEDIRSVYIFRGVIRFEVKWMHWEEQFNTIEPISNLNCTKILQKFLDVETTKYQKEIETLIKELAVGPLFTDTVLKEMIPLQDITYDKIELQSYLLALIDIPASKRLSAVMCKVTKLLQKKLFLDKRQAQLKALSDWEAAMNEVDFKGKLRVVNNVDFDGPPSHFTYIDKNIAVDDVIISNDPPLACSCDPCSFKSNCCGKMHGSEYAYSFERRLKHTGIYLFECNKKCKCGPECTNRVVQKGRTNKLCIFKTSNGCGWGVRTDRHIRAGDFVCEYMGEIIKSDEAEQRGILYEKLGITYLFDLDHIIKSSEAYTIDAYRYGNISHFINHSCEPNLCVVNVWIDCLDPNLSRLALFALQDIEKGQEITIDYKFSSSISIDENVITADNMCNYESIKFEKSLDDFLNLYEDSEKGHITDEKPLIDLGSSSSKPTESARTPESKYMICKCGAKKCRKILQYC